MNKQIRHLSAVLGIVFAVPATASAQCGSYTDIVSALEEKFGETRVEGGQASDGRVIEVFASTRRDTWTMVASLPGRPSCIISSGRGVKTVLAGLV